MSHSASPAPRAGLNWRWIGIGALIMFGLNLLAGLLVVPLLGGAVPAVGADGVARPEVALGWGRLLLAAAVSFASFAVGGFIVAVRSSGRTVVEPGISAAIAVAVGLLAGGALTPSNLFAGAVVPFLAGLLGGWLGERRQGTAR